jgi:hypothetical protein
VKLPLCLTKSCAMKLYVGVEVYIHVFLTLALVGSECHAPVAVLPGKDAPVPIVQKDWWAPEPVWIIWRSENYLPFRDSNSDPSTMQPPPLRRTVIS